MSKKLYVGNLSFQTTEEELNGIFSQFGAVESVTIITDRDTGRSKGFGFVVMEQADADKAIEQLNGSQLGGRNLTVNEARPMVKREFNDRGRGRGGGGGGGRKRY
ncbi:MAG TPA: RNA-binding protein [Terriglobia bacterium]|nr:RNA-binding protein [Terriglobia bacterium]